MVTMTMMMTMLLLVVTITVRLMVPMPMTDLPPSPPCVAVRYASDSGDPMAPRTSRDKRGASRLNLTGDKNRLVSLERQCPPM